MARVGYPIETANGVPVVAAPAEIDVSNADWLRAVLWEAAARGNGRLVDMTPTGFCASAGIGALVQAHNRALADGGELRLVSPTSRSVLRVFELIGIDQVIPSFASLDEAVEFAPPAPRPRRKRRRPKPRMRIPTDRQPTDPGAKPSPA
ncbi:MAG TPA: STAS domain-containing protein [Streptosporangiaceae bacterium]|jgi:anti-anti-sigma factor